MPDTKHQFRPSWLRRDLNQQPSLVKGDEACHSVMNKVVVMCPSFLTSCTQASTNTVHPVPRTQAISGLRAAYPGMVRTAEISTHWRGLFVEHLQAFNLP